MSAPDENVRFDTLNNGLRVVTEHMPGFESASIGIWVSAGGRHELAAQNGIAHFLEHMAFKGTKRRSSLQIAEAIEDVGGYINAYTSREVTAYYARVLKGDVALAFDVLADILRNPVFDTNEIEIERGVILQEIGQALDTPDDVVFDWLQEAAYPDQPMGRTILGPAARVQNFQRDDLAGFVREHYGPERMVVAAAGAIDHDQIMRLCAAAFGDAVRQPAAKIAPARFHAGARTEIKTLEQVHFTLGFQGPTYLDPEIYTAQIYAAALGGGMSSRLFQEIREKRGLCYSVFAQAGAYEDSGMITLYAGTSGDHIGELSHLMIDELKRAADDIQPQEVERARAQMKSGLLMGLESASSRAERLARLVGIWNYAPPLAETIAKIDAVTLENVRDFAADLVDKKQAAMAVYGPASACPTLDELHARLGA